MAVAIMALIVFGSCKFLLSKLGGRLFSVVQVSLKVGKLAGSLA